MFASLKSLWLRESVTKKLVETLEKEDVTRPESPPPNSAVAERFYEHAGWLNRSHRARQTLLTELGTESQIRELQSPRFVRHVYRSLALQDNAPPNFKDVQLQEAVQQFAARERQGAAASLSRAKDAAETGDFFGALKFCFEARDTLENLCKSDETVHGEACQLAFLMLLKTNEVKTAIEFLWQYPSMFQELKIPLQEMRSETERVLAANNLEAGPRLALRRVLHQLSAKVGPEAGGHSVHSTPATAMPLDDYAQRVAQATLSDDVRHKAEKVVRDLGRGAGEDSYRLERWLETVLQYPFGRIPPAVGNGNEQVEQVKTAMRERVTGHHKAKQTILDFVHQRASSSSASSNIIGLQGPPGNGKSTLLESLKVGLGIPYCEANLNGMANSGILFGVPKGIVGAGPGLFVQEIIRQGCASPVFLLEEVDKVSEGPGGTEVIHKLMALTDSLDNRHLVDDFLEGVRLSCPQSLIIFTLNNLDKIDPVLRSRIQIIQTEALSEADKKEVFDKHMLPKVAKAHGFDADTLKFAKSARNVLLRKYAQEGQMKQLSLELNTIVARASRGRSSGRFGNVVYVRKSQDHVVISQNPA